MAFAHRPDADHGRGRGARKACLRRAEADLSGKARVGRVDGHDEPDRAAGRLRPGRAARPRRARPATAPTASSARRFSSPMASTTSPTTSSIWCWRGCPTRRPARAASRCSSCRNSWSTTTARSARRNDVFCSAARAQARHPRLADLHHDLWRRFRPGDEKGAVGWLIGEENKGLACMFTMMNNARLASACRAWRRRSRLPEGARLCQ